MALNNLGWLVIVLLLNHRMSGIVVKMNEKLNPKWVKLLMGGATLGLFAYLLTNQLVGKTSIKWAAAILSGVIMLVLTTAFKKHQRIQELEMCIRDSSSAVLPRRCTGGLLPHPPQPLRSRSF